MCNLCHSAQHMNHTWLSAKREAWPRPVGINNLPSTAFSIDRLDVTYLPYQYAHTHTQAKHWKSTRINKAKITCLTTTQVRLKKTNKQTKEKNIAVLRLVLCCRLLFFCPVSSSSLFPSQRAQGGSQCPVRPRRRGISTSKQTSRVMSHKYCFQAFLRTPCGKQTTDARDEKENNACGVWTAHSEPLCKAARG